MERERKPRVFKIAEGAVRELEKLAKIIAGDGEASDEDPEYVLRNVIVNLRRRNPEFNDEYRTRNRNLLKKTVSDKRRAKQLKRFGDELGYVYLRRRFYQPENIKSIDPTVFEHPEGPFVYDLVPDEEYYVPCRVCGLGEPDGAGARWVEVRLINKDRTPTPWRTGVTIDKLYFEPEDGLKIVDFCDELHSDFVNSINWGQLHNLDEQKATRRKQIREWQARMNKQKEEGLEKDE